MKLKLGLHECAKAINSKALTNRNALKLSSEPRENKLDERNFLATDDWV
jgi:hypothetical protein